MDIELNGGTVIANPVLICDKTEIDSLAYIYMPLTGNSRVQLPWPDFLTSWRRRIGNEDESLFFINCANTGLEA